MLGASNVPDQFFLLLAFMVMVEVRRLNFCVGVQSVVQLGAFRWTRDLVFLGRFLWHHLIWDKSRHLATIWCKAHGLFYRVSRTDRLRD